jgi:hypothetical protein
LFVYLASLPLLGHGFSLHVYGSISIYIIANAFLFISFTILCLQGGLQNTININKIFIPQIFINLGFLLLSTFFLLNGTGIRYIASHIMILMLIISLASTLYKLDTKHILTALLIGGLALSFFDVLAFFDIIEGNKRRDSLDWGYAGIGTSMTFANHGAGMVFGIISALAMLKHKNPPKLNVFYYLSITLMLGMVLISQSRSSMLAAIIAILSYIVVAYSVPKNRSYLSIVIKFSFIVILAGLLSYFLAETRLNTVHYRLDGYVGVIKTIIHAPLGLGWDNWRSLYSTFGNVHNMVLSYTIALGIPGLCLALGLIGLGGYFLKTYLQNAKEVSVLFCASFAMFCGAFTEAMFAPQTPSDWINLSLIFMATALIQTDHKGKAGNCQSISGNP